MRKLISSDPETGKETWFHSQAEGDRRLWIIESRQDCSKFIERAKAEMNSKKRHTPWGDMQKVASLPLVVFTKLKREGILDDQRRFLRWLSDPENRHFRTRPGRLR